MKENPYFDPNPQWMFVVLKFWCLISLVLTAIGFYLLLYKSQTQSGTYRRMIIYHLVIGMIFELEFTVLSPPLIYLPYVAAEGKGVWSYLGIPPDVQFALLINFIVINAAGVTPLFYYRMDVLLPDGHALNKNFFRYGVYVTAFVFCYLSIFPLLMLAMNDNSQEVWKEEFIKEFNIHYDNFWNPTVLVVMLHSNPWAELIVLLVLIASIFVIEIIFGCTYVIYHTVQTHTSKLSIKTEQQHKAILLSLMALMLVLASIPFVIAPTVIYFFYFNSPRADLINIVIAIAGGIYPASAVAYLMSYKPYRRWIWALFKKEKVAPRRDSTIAFTNVRLDQQQLKRRQTLY